MQENKDTNNKEIRRQEEIDDIYIEINELTSMSYNTMINGFKDKIINNFTLFISMPLCNKNKMRYNRDYCKFYSRLDLLVKKIDNHKPKFEDCVTIILQIPEIELEHKDMFALTIKDLILTIERYSHDSTKLHLKINGSFSDYKTCSATIEELTCELWKMNYQAKAWILLWDMNYQEKILLLLNIINYIMCDYITIRKWLIVDNNIVKDSVDIIVDDYLTSGFMYNACIDHDFISMLYNYHNETIGDKMIKAGEELYSQDC